MLLFKRQIYEKRKEIALFLIVFIICFLILELGTSIYVCNFANYKLQARTLLLGECGGMGSRYIPHHYLSYRGTPNYKSHDGLNIHNSLGFRGPEITMPKPPDIYRIVTVGGSTTYTQEVRDWKKDFARQLEKQLRERYDYDKIEVINAGVSGWTSWENLISLEFVILDLEPDLIIFYLGGNDLGFSRLVNPKTYKSDNSGLRRVWKESPIPLIFRSKFIRLITGISPTGLDRYVFVPEAIAPIKANGFIDKFNGTLVETLQKNKPVYFERNLRSMIAISKEHDIKAVLATWKYTNQITHPVLPALELGIKEHNEIIKKVGELHNITVCDFASKMPSDKIYWADSIHLNELGVELKGKLFSDCIYSNNIMEKDLARLKDERSLIFN